MDDYIDIPLTNATVREEEFINLKPDTPKRIQIIYEISRNIEDISTSSQEST